MKARKVFAVLSLGAALVFAGLMLLALITPPFTYRQEEAGNALAVATFAAIGCIVLAGALLQPQAQRAQAQHELSLVKQ